MSRLYMFYPPPHLLFFLSQVYSLFKILIICNIICIKYITKNIIPKKTKNAKQLFSIVTIRFFKKNEIFHQ